jgi:hypothetical protein
MCNHMRDISAPVMLRLEHTEANELVLQFISRQQPLTPIFV